MSSLAVYGKLVEEMEKRQLRVFVDYTNLTPEQKLRVDHFPDASELDIKNNRLRTSWNQVYPHYPNFLFRIQAFNETATPSWSDDWEDAAGPWVDSIKDAGFMFGDGIMGLAHRPYFEWLRCDVCLELQQRPKSAGAPSARSKCNISFKCTGYMRRLPDVYELVKKVPKTSRVKKSVPKSKKAPGTPETRGRKGYSREVKLEAIRLSETGLSGSDAWRALRASHPEAAKVTVTTVIKWIKEGKDALRE